MEILAKIMRIFKTKTKNTVEAVKEAVEKIDKELKEHKVEKKFVHVMKESPLGHQYQDLVEVTEVSEEAQ